VRAADPSIAGLLLTSADDEALALSVLAGAEGSVIKLAGTTDIVDAVRRIGAGRSLLETSLAERIRGQLRGRADALEPPLTDRQAETLPLVLACQTDQQIAAGLQVPLELARDVVAQLIARLTRPLTLPAWLTLRRSSLTNAGPGRTASMPSPKRCTDVDRVIAS